MEFEFILDNSWSFFAFLIFKLIECTVGNKHFCALVQIFQLIKKKKKKHLRFAKSPCDTGVI